MILATCQCQHIFYCWVEPSLLLSSWSQVTLVPLASLRRQSPLALGSLLTSQPRRRRHMARMSSVSSSSRWEQDYDEHIFKEGEKRDKKLCQIQSQNFTSKIPFFNFGKMSSLNEEIFNQCNRLSEESGANASWTSPALHSPWQPRTLPVTKAATLSRLEGKSE